MESTVAVEALSLLHRVAARSEHLLAGACLAAAMDCSNCCISECSSFPISLLLTCRVDFLLDTNDTSPRSTCWMITRLLMTLATVSGLTDWLPLVLLCHCCSMTQTREGTDKLTEENCVDCIN